MNYTIFLNASNERRMLDNMTDLPPSKLLSLRDDIISIIMSSSIIIINSLIVGAFFLRKALQNCSANIFICNQAVADLFVGVVFAPMYVMKEYHDGMGFLTCYVVFLSLFNLFALSTDRYLAFSMPYVHRRFNDVRHALKVVLLIWIIPLGLTLVPLCWWFKLPGIKREANHIYSAIVCIFIILFIFALATLYLFISSRANRIIRHKRKKIMERASPTKLSALVKKEIRIMHLFGLLLFFFVATYLPIVYINLCVVIGEHVPLELLIINFYFFMSNGIVNPILCILLKRDYFNAIASIIRNKRKCFHNWYKSYCSIKGQGYSEPNCNRESNGETNCTRESNGRMLELKNKNYFRTGGRNGVNHHEEQQNYNSPDTETSLFQHVVVGLTPKQRYCSVL